MGTVIDISLTGNTTWKLREDRVAASETPKMAITLVKCQHEAEEVRDRTKAEKQEREKKNKEQ